MHVGHRAAVETAVDFELGQELAGRLVEGNDVAAVGRAVAELVDDRFDRDDQRLRHQDAALGDDAVLGRRAEPAEIQVPDRRVIARPLPQRHLPQHLAAVHVERGDPPVGRLEQGQALDLRHGPAIDRVPPVGTRRVGGRQRDRARPRQRRHVEDVGLRVEGGAGPVCAAARTRVLEVGALAVLAMDDRRREDRADHVVPDHLERFGPKLRREVDQVVVVDAEGLERRRPGGERLGARQLLTRNPRVVVDRRLDDRPDGFSGGPVEHVGHRDLRDDRHRLDLPAVDRDVDEVRGRGQVVVPDAVMDRLEVPDDLARAGVEADDRLGVDVVAVPVAAVVVVRRRAEGQVDVAELLVGAHHGPDVRVAHLPPGLVLPGLDVGLALARHGVERPLQPAAADVETAHVPGRVVVAVREIEDRAADHDRVGHDGHRRRPVHVSVRPPRQETLHQVDDAFLAELGIRLAGLRVDGHQTSAAGGDQDPLRLAVAPELDAADLDQRTSLLDLPVPRVVPPELLAGRRMERRDLAQVGRDVDDAVDHQRHAPVRPGRLVGHVLQQDIGRLPAPGDLQLLEVVPVDLFEGRVPGGAAVAAEVPPLAALRAVLRRGRRGGTDSGQKDAETSGDPRIETRHSQSPQVGPAHLTAASTAYVAVS